MLSNLESAWRYPLAVALGLVTGIYIGGMLATIYVIVAFRESLDTLSPLGLWFFRYPWADLEARPATLQGALIITGAVTVALTLVGLAGVHRGRLNQYDDAHFQTRRELKRNKMIGSLDQNGFIFGKLGSPKSDAPFVMAPPDRFPHAMMIAPTGRGKGVGFVIPNLLHFTGSGIILDVKGENFAKTSIHRQHGLKNAIWYFSPFDDERGSHRFNPLARIAALPSAERQYTALNSMADLFLIPEGESAQSFFNAGKRLFIASCLYAIEKRRPTLGYAGEIMAGGGDKKKTYTTIAEDTQIPIVSRTFLEMADVPEKTLGAYVSVIQGSGLELWNDPAVDRVTSASDFDFSTFRAKPQSLYIVVQPEHLKTLAPLVRLLFADAIASLQRKEPGPDEPHAVMFLMDEFDQLGRQPLVLSSIKTIRSFGGRFFIISQTIPGLDDIYGETGRRSLQGGAGVQIYMTPQDDRTADVLSSALGRSTVTAVTESQSRIRALEDSANVSRRSEERPLISANELLRFPLDEVLVLPEGQYPIRARHVRYYEDRHFGPIDRARKGVMLHDRNFLRPTVGTPGVAMMRSLIPNSDLGDSLGKASTAFAKLSQAAKSGPKDECR
ncbi:type IV secretory system conjugative DNA transfer family protein [Pseudotabrizicola sp. L79]|uniref:type IV secretory system conjugative DNA transfer family protein n=1 Tax=Pseudotabrizicola sp. L79 TaxID=3118402 RepID=UPI002F93651F